MQLGAAMPRATWRAVGLLCGGVLLWLPAAAAEPTDPVTKREKLFPNNWNTRSFQGRKRRENWGERGEGAVLGLVY